MKYALLAFGLSALAFGPVVAQPATPQTEKKMLAVVTSSRADAEAIVRANRLTERMAQRLRLNNYQTARLRYLNRERARQMYALEHQPGADPKKIDDDCQGVCRQQERDLHTLLSTTQYADYYEDRNDFYAFDKQYVAQGADPTRRPGASRQQQQQPQQIELPGRPAAPELKESNASPVLRQGK